MKKKVNKSIADRLDLMLRIDANEKNITCIREDTYETGFIINHKFYSFWFNEMLFDLNFKGDYIRGFEKLCPKMNKNSIGNKYYKIKLNLDYLDK